MESRQVVPAPVISTTAKLLTTARAGEPEWKAAHRGKIGSTEVASFFRDFDNKRIGRKSTLRIWEEMTEKVEKEDISHLPVIKRGIWFEPVVAQMFTEETGREINPPFGLFQHPTLDFLVCTPDGSVASKAGAPAIWEAKSVGLHRRFEWNKDVPMRTQIQGGTMCWVLGIQAVVFGAICLDEEEDEEGGTENNLLLWAEKERNPQVEEIAGNVLTDFYEKNVKRDVPPDPDGDLASVKALFPRPTIGEVVDFTRAQEITVMRKLELASMETELKHKHEALKAEIAMWMGTAEYGRTPGGIILKNGLVEKDAYTVGAQSYRQIRKVKKVGS